jgi:Fe-S cluster biogenesis protein NfuA
MDDAEVRQRVERVEELIARIEDDPAALEALRAVVELYGEGLRRVVAHGAVDGAADDELVSHLLLVHDLHPKDLETRVQEALDAVRPYLGTHGGDVELLGVVDGVAKLRLAGTCDGCPSSAVTLKNAIEEALLRAAPDLDGIEAEGVADPQPVLVQLGSLQCPTELQRA